MTHFWVVSYQDTISRGTSLIPRPMVDWDEWPGNEA